MEQDLMNDAALRGMALHLRKFLGRETAGLAENAVIHGDFAQVVRGSGLDEAPAERLGQGQPSSSRSAPTRSLDSLRCVFDMTAGGIVPTFYHRGQAHDQMVMHLQNVLGFPIHFRIQLGIIGIQVLEQPLVGGIVDEGDDIAPAAVAVIEVVDDRVVEPVMLRNKPSGACTG